MNKSKNLHIHIYKAFKWNNSINVKRHLKCFIGIEQNRELLHWKTKIIIIIISIDDDDDYNDLEVRRRTRRKRKWNKKRERNEIIELNTQNAELWFNHFVFATCFVLENRLWNKRQYDTTFDIKQTIVLFSLSLLPHLYQKMNSSSFSSFNQLI